jgi:hypothetical protein
MIRTGMAHAARRPDLSPGALLGKSCVPNVASEVAVEEGESMTETGTGHHRDPPVPGSPLTNPRLGIDPDFDPVTQLGLESYSAASLSDAETRRVYVEGERRMLALHAELTENGVDLESRARKMYGLRDALRVWTRRLMANNEGREALDTFERNRTFEQLIAVKQAAGLLGDQLYESIIESSTRSRPEVNEACGVDPEDPGPLPSIR